MTGDREAPRLLDLVGRLVLAQRTNPRILVEGLRLSAANAEELVACGTLPDALDDERRERLIWLSNALIRVEWKFVASDAIREALTRPIGAFEVPSPTDMRTGSLNDLRRLRGEFDAIRPPRTKWRRVGHN